MQLPARFTPPLSDNFETDGDRLIDLVELCWVTPETDTPLKLDDWQKWLFRAMLERYPADHPEHPNELRYRQIVVSMGRQNGKSVVGGALALEALAFRRGDCLSLASSREQAYIIYTRVKHVIDSTSWLAKRFKKTIDPQLLSDSDENPELQAAQQQMEAMGQEMEQMHQMIQNVGKSIEMQDMKRKDYEAEIKAYQAETQRISAVQAGMTEQQIQDIAMGVVAAAMESNDQIGGIPEMREMQPEQPEEMMQPPMEGMAQ